MAFIQLTDGADNHGGQPSSDQIEGLSGNDTIHGGAGGDILVGGSSEWRVVTQDVEVRKVGDNDLLLGEDDNDWFWIGAGKDTIDGGAGFNRIEFAFSNITIYGQFVGFYTETLCSLQEIVVNLKTGTYTANVREGTPDVPGGVLHGTVRGKLSNVQEVHGSMLGDKITGGHAANDDLERFRGLGGNDTIDGGTGFDQLTYFGFFAGQTGGVNLTFTSASAGTAVDDFGDTDTFKNVEAAIGSRFDDTLTGTGGTQTFSGSDGADSIDGKGGTDLVDYNFDFALAGVQVNLQLDTATDGFGKTDTLVNIEDVRGTFFVDTILGSVFANTLFGASGNDSIEGSRGNDTLHGDAGEDTLKGGRGKDVLLGWDDGDLLVGDEDNDSLEGMSGNDTLSDVLVSDIRDALDGRGGNTLNGGDESDTLFGIGRLDGGDDNDLVQGLGVLKGGLGNDRVEARKPVDFDDVVDIIELEGGLGKDTIKGSTEFTSFASYAYSDLGVEVLLDSGVAKVTSRDRDTLINVSGVIGSDHDDRVIGTEGVNVLNGGKGDDLLEASGGQDFISGEAGNDTLWAGGGKDQLDGGVGNDSISGDADGRDELIGGIGNDTIETGIHSDDTVSGGSGNDRLTILGGTDDVDAGLGNDTIVVERQFADVTGGGGIDRFVYRGTAGGDIADFNAKSEKIDLSDYGFKTFAAFKKVMTEGDLGVEIEVVPGAAPITLLDVDLTDLSARNFIL